MVRSKSNKLWLQAPHTNALLRSILTVTTVWNTGETGDINEKSKHESLQFDKTLEIKGTKEDQDKFFLQTKS